MTGKKAGIGRKRMELTEDTRIAARSMVNKTVHMLKPGTGEVCETDPWAVVEWARDRLRRIVEETNDGDRELKALELLQSGALVQARIMADVRSSRTVESGSRFDAMSPDELRSEVEKILGPKQEAT